MQSLGTVLAVDARAFWTLVASSGLSNLADGVFKVALPLVALEYTRSPALVAGLELVRSLPWLLGSLQAGALIDRLDRRRAMVVANAARAAFVAIPAVAIAAGGGSLALLYVAAVGTGICEVFYDTAAQSILPSIVPRSDLDRANGRLYAVELGSQEFAGHRSAACWSASPSRCRSPRRRASGSWPSPPCSSCGARSVPFARGRQRPSAPMFARG